MALTLAAALALPACSGVANGHYHTVQPGENLYRIGRRYGVDHQRLAYVNGIGDVTSLSVGQRIWIPKRGDASTRRAPPPTQAAKAAPAKKAVYRETRRAGEPDFIWPVPANRITSGFGRRNGRPHEGIDIRAPRGTRIRAAEAGKVIHAGWLGDYGKVVIIKHAGHYRSVYAHAAKIYVKRGDFVDRGQRIAAVGSTGRSTGPHLHFEIRRGESPRDPMRYLP